MVFCRKYLKINRQLFKSLAKKLERRNTMCAFPFLALVKNEKKMLPQFGVLFTKTW